MADTPNQKRKRHLRRLRHTVGRIRRILAEKEADKAAPIVLQTMRAEISALEWALRELGEEAPLDALR